MSRHPPASVRTIQVRGVRYTLRVKLITESSDPDLNGTYQVNAYGPGDVMPAHYSSGHESADAAVAAAREALRA